MKDPDNNLTKPAGKLGPLAAGAVALLVLAIYGQTLRFGYVNYDDIIILGDRWQNFRLLSWEGLSRIFSFHRGATYQPVRDLALALAQHFWGTDPLGYHLFNILLYLANLAVVYFLFRKLWLLSAGAGAGPGSRVWPWIAAAWFAVHPVHVESVAWMISNKEVLAGLFFFLAFLCYLSGWQRGFSMPHYLGSWAFFILAMLSKPSTAAFPLVVLAFELLYREKGGTWKVLLLRLGPFAAVSAAAAGYFVFFTTTFTGRLLQESLAVHALSFASVLAKYIKIMVFPVNLCHSYPPPFFSGDYNYRLALYLLVDLGAIAALVWSLVRRKREMAFGILFFLLNLLPVSGILPISIFMADRYLYLSSFGFVFAAVLLLEKLWLSFRGSVRARGSLAAALALTLVLLTALSANRCRVWKDQLSLWGNAVRTYPNFQFNHYGLGLSLFRAGHLREALDAFGRVNLFKEHLNATFYMARIYDQLGDSTAAVQYYARAAGLAGQDTDEPEKLAYVYERLGQGQPAAGQWLKYGMKLESDDPALERTVNKIIKLGYPELAAGLLAAKAPSAKPSSGMLTRLAGLQFELGQTEKALQSLERARSDGENPGAVAALGGDIFFKLGRWDKVIDCYSMIPLEKLHPTRQERLAAGLFNTRQYAAALRVFRYLENSSTVPSAAACNNVGVALEALDSLQAAESQYLRAVKLMPDYVDAWFNLGNLSRKKGQPGKALEFYDRAAAVRGSAGYIELARAETMMELGRYREAYLACRRAAALDSTSLQPLLGAADALWAQGDRQAAARYYREYLDRGGDAIARDTARDRLGQIQSRAAGANRKN